MSEGLLFHQRFSRKNGGYVSVCLRLVTMRWHTYRWSPPGRLSAGCFAWNFVDFYKEDKQPGYVLRVWLLCFLLVIFINNLPTRICTFASGKGACQS
jgi:hypothetical protein